MFCAKKKHTQKKHVYFLNKEIKQILFLRCMTETPKNRRIKQGKYLLL